MSMDNSGIGSPGTSLPPLVMAPGIPSKEWTNAVMATLRAGFESSNPDDWEKTYDYATLICKPRPGPYDPGLQMADAFRREVAGRLRNNPLAHAALSQVLLDRGDRTGAAKALDAGLRLAHERALSTGSPGDRKLASLTNHRAAQTLAKMGHQTAAVERLAISRYFSATAAHRSGRLGVHKAVPFEGTNELTQSRAPVMGPKRPAPSPPHHLTEHAERGEQPELPESGGEPGILGFTVLRLLNALGTYIGAHQKMSDLADYLRKMDTYLTDREFLPAPLQPDELRSLMQDFEQLRTSGTRTEKRAVGEFLRRFNFDTALEISQAYWGQR